MVEAECPETPVYTNLLAMPPDDENSAISDVEMELTATVPDDKNEPVSSNTTDETPSAKK